MLLICYGKEVLFADFYDPETCREEIEAEGQGFTNGHCWGLVLKCFGLRTRQHKKRLMVNALHPSKHYFP
jgi:hypothetical protein